MFAESSLDFQIIKAGAGGFKALGASNEIPSFPKRLYSKSDLLQEDLFLPPFITKASFLELARVSVYQYAFRAMDYCGTIWSDISEV